MNYQRRYILDITGKGLSCNNLRDLGGYPVGQDKQTNWGVLLRSDLPAGLSNKDEQFFRDMGISTIIDLRSEEEANIHPCYFRNLDGFDYHHYHLMGDLNFTEDNDDSVIAQSYFSMTKNPIYTKIFKTLANAPEGALFHCTAGKDRTGTTAAILLMLAGVSTPDVVADYTITYPYLGNLVVSMKENYPDLPEFVGMSKPEWITDFIDMFVAEYESAENFLSGIGLNDEEISKLRAKLVTEE